MYREYPSRLPGAIVWQSTASAGRVVRVLPDGCMDLIWDGTSVMIAGPDTSAHLFETDRDVTLTGLRMAPGQGPLVVGIPADEVVDTRVPLDAVWSSAKVRQVTDALSDTQAMADTLEDIAAAHLPDVDAERRLIEHVVALASSGHNSTAIAEHVGLSTRQLQRKSSAAFGYGPKMLGRILRLQRALTLAYDGVGKAEAAARAGYADQPHLSRDVKEFAGVPLGTLTR